MHQFFELNKKNSITDYLVIRLNASIVKLNFFTKMKIEKITVLCHQSSDRMPFIIFL